MKKFVLLLAAGFLLTACVPADNHVDIADAQNQIYFASQYKMKQCNPPSMPSMPLVITAKPLQRHLDLCTIAITDNTECPFVNYPLACVMVYLPENTPIPWYVSFKDVLSKQIK